MAGALLRPGPLVVHGRCKIYTASVAEAVTRCDAVAGAVSRADADADVEADSVADAAGDPDAAADLVPVADARAEAVAAGGRDALVVALTLAVAESAPVPDLDSSAPAVAVAPSVGPCAGERLTPWPVAVRSGWVETA
jgi:hypothetical protein